jgi:small subunit ribosomal protein S8
MSMTDPIADLLTRIRNAQRAHHPETEIPYSGVKAEIARVLKSEGYVDDVRTLEEGARQKLRVGLRYTEDGRPLLSGIERVSRPGRRVYAGADEIPPVLGGLGICILSTSQGVMSDREARRRRVGGELLCNVW